MNKEQERIEWIDMAKGYGILAVIYSHISHVGLKSLCHIFHMPLFIFLSGYTYKIKNDWKQMAIKKAKRLMIPYIIFGIIGGFIEELCINKLNSVHLINILTQLLFQRRYLIIWYIMMIFILEMIMYFPIKYIKSEKKLFIISLLIYVIGRVYFFYNPQSAWILNLDTCLTCQFWFVLGYLFSKRGLLNNNKGNYNIKIASISLIVMLISGAINYLLCGNNLNIYSNLYALPLITEIGAISGILMIISISKIKTFKFIKMIGKNSIIFMLVHPIIIDIFQVLIFKNHVKYLDNVLGAIITFALSIIIGTLLIICYKKFINKRSKKNYVTESTNKS